MIKTRIRTEGDTAIIAVDGQLDVEVQEPLRQRLMNLAGEIGVDTGLKKFIFDFENLEFVGSCGITSFVNTLKEFNARSSHRPRYASVASEFQRIIRAFDRDEDFDFFETVESARRSFDQ